MTKTGIIVTGAAEDPRRGAFEFCAPTNDVFEVTGMPAEDFETTARRYAALPKASTTLGNSLRAWIYFVPTPLGPGYRLNRYAGEHNHPVPPAPRVAMNNTAWKMEHATEVTVRPVVQRAVAGASR